MFNAAAAALVQPPHVLLFDGSAFMWLYFQVSSQHDCFEVFEDKLLEI